jgi:hypothetical protein
MVLKKISDWVKSKQIESTPIQTPTFRTTQEDPRIVQQQKEIKAWFDAQQQEMDAIGLKLHERDCDVINCTSNPCFIREPDKIVSQPYTVDKKSGKRI